MPRFVRLPIRFVLVLIVRVLCVPVLPLIIILPYAQSRSCRSRHTHHYHDNNNHSSVVQTSMHSVCCCSRTPRRRVWTMMMTPWMVVVTDVVVVVSFCRFYSVDVVAVVSRTIVPPGLRDRSLWQLRPSLWWSSIFSGYQS